MADGKRLIDADALKERMGDAHFQGYGNAIMFVMDAHVVDAVEVVPGYHVGDVCFYGFGSKTNCLALVEIQKILDDERGVAEIKFLKVFADTGNNFFDYLLRTGQTMNGSFEYLKNITPKREATKSKG